MKLTRFAVRIFAAALALVPTAVAQTPAPAVPAVRDFIYHVDGPRSTVYLVGSVHLLPADAYPLAPALEAAYADAERFTFEVHPDSLEAAQAGMATIAQIPDGRTLADVLTPETRALMDAKLAEIGLPYERVARLQPWIVGVGVFTGMEYAKAGLSPEHGLDLHFAGRAKAAGKPVGHLETIQSQLDLFGGMTDAEQDACLRFTIEELPKAAAGIHEMVAAWKAGDAARLDALMNEGMDRFPALRTKLLTDRNARWLPQIEAMLAAPGDEDVLVVVGAAHLVGHDGVVEMLRARGYRVEQL